MSEKGGKKDRPTAKKGKSETFLLSFTSNTLCDNDTRLLLLQKSSPAMHLMYTIDSEGKRAYTLKKVVGSEVTKSAHPARFSPDDKYSRYAIFCIRREYSDWD